MESPLRDDVDEEHNQRNNVWNGVLKAIGLRLVNPYLGINIVRLGAPNLFLGVMIAIPYLAQGVAAWGGRYWLTRPGNAHRRTVRLFLAARLGFLLLAAVDFWGRGPNAALAFLIAVIVLNVPAASATIAWQTFLGQALSPARRAKAVMWRQWGMNAVGIATLIIGGGVIGQAQGVRAYGEFDVVAAMVGVGEAWVYGRFRMRETVSSPSVAGGGEFHAPKRFWQFVGAGSVFYFGWLFLWPVALRYQVSNLQATNAWMAIWAGVNAAITMIALPLWQRGQRRWPVAHLLPVAALIMAGVPIGYIFSPSHIGVVVLNILGGFGGAGFNLLVLLRLLDLAPADQRLQATSLYAVATNLAGGLGAIAAVWGLSTVGISWTASMSGALRLLGAALLLLAGGAWVPLRSRFRSRLIS